MAKKNNLTTFLVVGIVALLIVGGLGAFWYFGSYQPTAKTESTSSDGMATLTATFYNDKGDEIVGGVAQSLVGGTKQQTGMILQLSATNIGNIDLTNVRVTNPNTNMDDAFDNVNPLANLLTTDTGVLVGSTGQPCPNGISDCDSKEYCSVSAGDKCVIDLDQYASGTSEHNVDFTLSLTGDFYDATGTSQSTTSDPVILTYDIREEKCTDGTTINSCVHLRTSADSDKPSYCQFAEGSLPSVVNKASLCGCPAGYQESGDDCVLLTCSDGTNYGECSTTRKGSACTTDGIGSFCKCIEGTLTADYCNACGCSNDFHSNPSTGCSGGTDPASCLFQDYSGGLTAGLQEG